MQKYIIQWSPLHLTQWNRVLSIRRTLHQWRTLRRWGRAQWGISVSRESWPPKQALRSEVQLFVASKGPLFCS